MKILFVALVLFGACSHQAKDLSERQPANVILNQTWKGYLESKVGPFPNLFPDAKYLKMPWTTYHEFDVDGTKFPPNRIQVLSLNCRDKKLYPTHPQQFTKDYIMGVVAPYDRLTLPALSSSCIIPNPTKKFCLSAQRAVVAVMSDTYQDSCGNLYRGYWMVSYRIGGGPKMSEDTMGTLFAKGRTQYEKPHSDFPGKEFIDGNTYAVDQKEFLVLGTLLPTDKKKILEAQSIAFKGGFRKQGLIWIPKGQR